MGTGKQSQKERKITITVWVGKLRPGVKGLEKYIIFRYVNIDIAGWLW